MSNIKNEKLVKIKETNPANNSFLFKTLYDAIHQPIQSQMGVWRFSSGQPLPILQARNYHLIDAKCNSGSFTDFNIIIEYVKNSGKSEKSQIPLPIVSKAKTKGNNNFTEFKLNFNLNLQEFDKPNFKIEADPKMKYDFHIYYKIV